MSYLAYPLESPCNEPSDEFNAAEIPHIRTNPGEWASPPFYVYHAGPYQALTVRTSEYQQLFAETIDTGFRYYSPSTVFQANFTKCAQDLVSDRTLVELDPEDYPQGWEPVILDTVGADWELSYRPRHDDYIHSHIGYEYLTAGVSRSGSSDGYSEPLVCDTTIVPNPFNGSDLHSRTYLGCESYNLKTVMNKYHFVAYLGYISTERRVPGVVPMLLPFCVLGMYLFAPVASIVRPGRKS